jgi:hypothetical protein
MSVSLTDPAPSAEILSQGMAAAWPKARCHIALWAAFRDLLQVAKVQIF